MNENARFRIIKQVLAIKENHFTKIEFFLPILFIFIYFYKKKYFIVQVKKLLNKFINFYLRKKKLFL